MQITSCEFDRKNYSKTYRFVCVTPRYQESVSVHKWNKLTVDGCERIVKLPFLNIMYDTSCNYLK